MHSTPDMSLWQGRSDPEETGDARRWHHIVKPWTGNESSGIALIGFACDEGVRRNKGRTGAREAPNRIRRILANNAWHGVQPIFDVGNISCDNEDLESTQHILADSVAAVLDEKNLPIVLGGGHEVAWGSFSGLHQHLQRKGLQDAIGILNIDAHFDLRAGRSSSGTPFRQIAELHEKHQQPFHYACLGVSKMANTLALFDRADKLGVHYRLDSQCGLGQLQETRDWWQKFLDQCDSLYLTICLDGLDAAAAPGVSAPATRGLAPEILELLISDILEQHRQQKLRLWIADIAECNPHYDIDNRTVKLAARLVNQLSQISH